MDELVVCVTAPFFDDEPRGILDALDAMLTEMGVTFWSPRHRASRDEAKTSAREWFDKNWEGFARCNVTLTRTDGFDSGIIMLVANHYGFLVGLAEVKRILTHLQATGSLPPDLYQASASE